MDRERRRVLQEAGCSWIVGFGGVAIFLRIIDASLVEFFSCFGFVLLYTVVVWAAQLIVGRKTRKP